MNGLILAAGRGSRMGVLTEDAPKCVAPLAGKPLIEWQLDAMQRAGLGRIAIVTGYRDQMIRDYADHAFHNPRWANTQMVMSLVQAESWLTQWTCIVSYSDIVYKASVVSRLMASEGDLAITYDGLWKELWRARFDDPLSDAESFELDEQGQLMSIGRPASTSRQIQGQYMGLLKITPKSWGWIEAELRAMRSADRDRLDMTSLLSHLLSAGMPISTVRVEGEWCEVDNEQDLSLYEDYVAHGMPWKHDWRED